MQQPTNVRIPFTKEAYEKLQKDYARLTKERAEVMERLKVAREQGDLSENGAYKYAKFELGNIGRQLRKIQHLLDTAVVTQANHNGTVGFGSIVALSHNGQKIQYMLVTEHESNPLENKLSLESPIGSALKGKKVGDVVSVTVPSGIVEYTILSIE